MIEKWYNISIKTKEGLKTIYEQYNIDHVNDKDKLTKEDWENSYLKRDSHQKISDYMIEFAEKFDCEFPRKITKHFLLVNGRLVYSCPPELYEYLYKKESKGNEE